ncbi:MAG: molybdopterin-dependent oxidoreductase [Bacteroidetes bacterium]|nr:molybdopterin-dependent oxidoreductase [Bacteroidota bacterium]
MQLSFAIAPGTNVALLNMMLYYIVKENLQDKNFIAARTEGYDEFKKAYFEA